MGKPTYGEFSFPSDFGFSGSGGKEMVRGYARGGAKKKTMAKVGKVMQEFAEGELHSGSKKGPKVTNPKQALAIGYSEAKAKKAQAGGRILQDESMQGRLPQNAAMAAQREAGTTMPNRLMPARALRPMGATMTDRERAMMDPARRVQRPQPDVSPDRARARVMEQMEEMGGRRVARKDGGRTKHEDAKMDKKVVEKAVKKHASLPAAKAHKGLGVPVHKSKPKIA